MRRGLTCGLHFVGNLGSFTPFMPSFRAFLPSAAMLVLVLAGCREPKVTSYRAPKDVPSTVRPGGSAVTAAPDGGGMTAPVPVAGGDELVWTAPSNWESGPPSAMRKATYIIHGDKDAQADLSITAFPGDVGGELANLNRWRGQLHLPPLAEGDATPGVTHLEQAGLKLTLVDISSLPPTLSQRMLGVIVPTGANTWFFKLSGPADLLEQNKQAFADFVQTIQPGGTMVTPPPSPTMAQAPGGSMANTAVPTASGQDLTWTAPGDWIAKPASAMRKATFAVPGDSGAEAELSITAFPGDVGGELANLNRWRGQVQLPPLANPTDSTDVTRFEQGGLKFTLADFSGAPSASPQRILGAIVPVGDATWFFKLSGPTAVIDQQKGAFVTFLKTIQAP
jgi:hypothetical protein